MRLTNEVNSTESYTSLDPDEIIELIREDSSCGVCVKCGYQQYGVEPDARGYQCEDCGQNTVYGAEECLLMLV